MNSLDAKMGVFLPLAFGDFALTITELAVIDLLNDQTQFDQTQFDQLRKISADAFQLFQGIPCPVNPMDEALVYLKLACFGVLGDCLQGYLKEFSCPQLPLDSESWAERVLATVFEAWLCLIRNEVGDLDRVLELVAALRKQQKNFEAEYLDNVQSSIHTAAWELIALYHLAKAAELLAIDQPDDIRQQLDIQFNGVNKACKRAGLIELEYLARILARTAQQLIEIRLEE